MAYAPKRYQKSPLARGIDVVMTAGAPMLLGNVVAATTNGFARTVDIGIRTAAGAITWLSRAIPVAAGGSAKATPGASTALNTGDQLIALSSGATAGQQIGAAALGPWPSVPNLLLSNTDGSVIVAACGANGLWVSLDGQQTAFQVRGGALGSFVGAFFGGKFHIYTGVTSKLEGSADGLTWTAVACVNAPVASGLNVFGNMVVKGAELYGIASGGTQLFKSTDGVNFAAHGAAFPPGTSATIQGLIWTGINWVVSLAYSGSTYGTWYAPAAATAWTASTNAPAGAVARCLASVGSTVISTMGGSGQGAYSTDHGATFTADATLSLGASSSILSTGAAFVLATSAGAEQVSATGLPGSWRTSGAGGDGLVATGATGRLGSTGPTFSLAAAKVIGPGVESVDLALNLRGGLSVTATTLETV